MKKVDLQSLHSDLFSVYTITLHHSLPECRQLTVAGCGHLTDLVTEAEEGACLARERPPNVETGLECESLVSRLMCYILYLWLKKDPLMNVFCMILSTQQMEVVGRGYVWPRALPTRGF